MRILITGMSGVGKTTALAELQKLGYVVIDLDATGICRWKNKTTQSIVEYGLDGKDAEWLNEHGWYCDLETLKTLLSCIREDKYVFVAGMPENIKEFSEIFNKTFVLKADDNAIAKRLGDRTNNHFAKKDDERVFMLKHTQELLSQIENTTEINTHNKPEEVAQLILDNI